MLKKFFIDDQNNFVFNTIFTESDNFRFNDEFIMKEVTLSINKRNLIDTIKHLCSNRDIYRHIVLNGDGFVTLSIQGNFDVEYVTDGLPAISIVPGETFSLNFFCPELDVEIPMREFMPYDLIDFIDEHK